MCMMKCMNERKRATWVIVTKPQEVGLCTSDGRFLNGWFIVANHGENVVAGNCEQVWIFLHTIESEAEYKCQGGGKGVAQLPLCFDIACLDRKLRPESRSIC